MIQANSRQIGILETRLLQLQAPDRKEPDNTGSDGEVIEGEQSEVA